MTQDAPPEAVAHDRSAGGPITLTVSDLVHETARRAPDAIAVSGGGENVTYRELTRRAAAVTATLRERGTGRGDAVAVRVAPGAWQAIAMLGVLDAGAYLVCLRTGDIGRSGKDSLARVRPACLVVDGDRDGAGPSGADGDDEVAAWFRAELDRPVIDVAATRGELDAVPSPAPSPCTVGERAYVAFTSGSTGSPKGIPMTHAALAQLTGWFAEEFGIGPGVRVAQWAAAGYDASLVETFAPLIAGGTLCPVPAKIRPNPDTLAVWLADEDVSVFQTVPSFARALVRVIGHGGIARQLGGLDHLLLAGEALSARLANELRDVLPGVRLVNLYGPTECVLATWCEIGESLAGPAPIGRPIPGRTVLVIDEQDRPCPSGVTGEIVIGSRYLTPGYLGADASDAHGPDAAFRPPAADGCTMPGRWYRTGDRGRLRSDGLFEFAGRADSQVKLLGTRLELSEVEAALLAHPDVRDCAVLARHDDAGTVARLTAYVVGRGEATAAELRAHLRQRFGTRQVPVSVTWLPELPRNLGGKVDRRALASAAHGPSR